MTATSLPENVIDSAAASATETDAAQVRRALEALLFVACEPLREDELAKLIAAPKADVSAALQELEQDFAQRGFVLRRIAGGWQLVTPEDLAQLVERLYHPKYQQLSAAALETLAIIAYKQPITRAEIGAIRQVDSDGVVTTLLEKKLIREVGRVAAAGRAILYGTSNDFLAFFGLNSLADLPELPSDAEISEDNFVL